MFGDAVVLAAGLAVFGALFVLNATIAALGLFRWLKRGGPKHRIAFSAALTVACGVVLVSGANELWRGRCATRFVTEVVAELGDGVLPRISAEMSLLDIAFLEQCRGRDFPQDQTISTSSAAGRRCTGEVSFPTGERLLVDFHDMRIYPWWRTRYFATPEFAVDRIVLIPHGSEDPKAVADI